MFKKELFLSLTETLLTLYSKAKSILKQSKVTLSQRLYGNGVRQEYLIKVSGMFKVQDCVVSRYPISTKYTAFCSLVHKNENYSFICWLPKSVKAQIPNAALKRELSSSVFKDFTSVHDALGSIPNTAKTRASQREEGNCANLYQLLKREGTGVFHFSKSTATSSVLGITPASWNDIHPIRKKKRYFLVYKYKAI